VAASGSDERPWSRAVDPYAPTFDELDRFLEALLKGERLTGFEILGGGRANTNIRLARVGDPEDDLVLRLYQRDPGQREKEVAVIGRLWGKVPVPDIIVHGDDASVLHAPYVLMHKIPGRRIEERFASLDGREREVLGQTLGRILASLHAVRFEQAGFLDDDLKVITPLPGGGRGLLDAAGALLATGEAATRLDETRSGAIRAHLAGRSERFDHWPGSACLVHGDFGLSNILIDGNGDGLSVTGVLDWEFAMAATPFLDLGNLIRPPAGDDARFMAGLERGYRATDPGLPDDWADLARAVDLLAWVDFAGRPDTPDDLLNHARAMIDRITAC